MSEEYIKFLQDKKYLNQPHIFKADYLNGKQNTWSMDVKDGTILYHLCKKRSPDVVLEIGTFHGHSGGYMLSALEENNKGFLYTIEVNEEYIGIANVNLNKVSKRYKILSGVASISLKGRVLMKDKWAKPIDFLFVDGDHSFESVKSDLEMYEPFITKNGIIACHDYYGVVKNAVITYFADKKDKFFEFILHDDGYSPTEFQNWLFIAVKL